MDEAKTLGTERIFRCPFCSMRGTRGVIAADMHALLQTARSGEPVEEDIEWSPDQPRPIFLFDPDGVSNAPCPHIVSVLLDAYATTGTGEDSRSLVMHTTTWDHPWFAKNDPEKEAEIFLWEYDHSERAFYPDTRFEFIRLDDVGREVQGDDVRLDISGTVIVAIDVEQFFEELPVGVEQRRAYWDHK